MLMHMAGGFLMRRQRIEYDGAVYHVTQRSSNREKYLIANLIRKSFSNYLASKS